MFEHEKTFIFFFLWARVMMIIKMRRDLKPVLTTWSTY